MTTLREAAQQALEALETLVPTKGPSVHNSARDALRAALAQQDDPTDPGHDVDVLREHVRHLERRVRELHAQQAEPVGATGATMNETTQPATAGPVERGVRHRAAFEAWISAPPFEREVERFGENSAWPGNYRELDVDLAWCAWSDAMATARERCANLCEQSDKCTHPNCNCWMGVCSKGPNGPQEKQR